MYSYLNKFFIFLLASLLFINLTSKAFAHETGPSYVVINDEPTLLNIVHAFGHNPGFTLATDLAHEDSYEAGSLMHFRINKENFFTPENAPAEFRWDFQDGTPVQYGDEVTHTFESAGSHFVNIESRHDPKTPYTLADTVQINITSAKNYELPVAKIMVNDKLITDFKTQTPVPLNKTIEFDASQSVGKNLRYYWELGDGTRSRDKKVSHTYTASGESTYYVVLRVSDDQGIVNDSIVTLLTTSITPSPAPSSNVIVNFFRSFVSFFSKLFSKQ